MLVIGSVVGQPIDQLCLHRTRRLQGAPLRVQYSSAFKILICLPDAFFGSIEVYILARRHVDSLEIIHREEDVAAPAFSVKPFKAGTVMDPSSEQISSTHCFHRWASSGPNDARYLCLFIVFHNRWILFLSHEQTNSLLRAPLFSTYAQSTKELQQFYAP